MKFAITVGPGGGAEVISVRTGGSRLSREGSPKGRRARTSNPKGFLSTGPERRQIVRPPYFP